MTHRPDWSDYPEDLEPAARPFDWRLIIGLCLLQLTVMGVVVWWLV